MARWRVVYLNVATDDVYAIIRSEALPEIEVVTLKSGDEQEVRTALAEADALLVATAAVTDEVMSWAPKLKLIQHQGVGYEKIDLAAAARRGIRVALTPEGTTTGVAEHTVLLILALYKRLYQAESALRAGRWLQWELRSNSYELAGKRVGLVGFGRIGRAVAKRLLAFEAEVTFFDPLIDAREACMTVPGAREVSFEELLERSDIVSLHVPVTPQTRGMIGAKELAMMPPRAVLVNTARGSLVDEKALYEALASRRIAGAALDVFNEEPLPPGSPLLKLENVVLTPHIAAGTVDALRTKMRAAFANIVRVMHGEAPRHEVREGA